jgi:cytochrome c5
MTLTACGGGSNADDAAKARPPGELTYQRFCISCHASGISGAPPTGNAEAWRPRLAQGDAILLKHTRDGMPSGGMPPKGLCSPCSDQELADAIHYMVNAKP